MSEIVIGFCLGALVMGAGNWIGYEIGRAARGAKPLIRMPKRNTEEPPAKKEYGSDPL